jgi:hypothetical protein
VALRVLTIRSSWLLNGLLSVAVQYAVQILDTRTIDALRRMCNGGEPRGENGGVTFGSRILKPGFRGAYPRIRSYSVRWRSTAAFSTEVAIGRGWYVV